MTLSEFKYEFDILYDSVTSNTAPPLNDYEVSVLLTQAQQKYIINLYDSELKPKGFESSEKVRKALSNLIRTQVNITPKDYFSDAINQRSSFFELNDDVMFLIYERVKLSSNDPCLKNKNVDVVPVTYDQYAMHIDNPFKKPNESVSWRLDNRKINNKNVVEILTADNSKPSEYLYKYIKYPKPIIVSNIDETINGLSTATDCELAEFTHREIVDLAVQIALEAIGSPRLQSKIGIDNKNK